MPRRFDATGALVEESGSSDTAFFDAYDTTGGLDVTGGVTIAIDTVRENSGDFSLSSGEVTVNKTGKFLVNVASTLGVGTSTARSAAITTLQLYSGSWAAVTGAKCKHYCRETDEDATTGAINAIVDITSGDKLRLVGIRHSGTAAILTIADMSSIVIRELV